MQYFTSRKTYVYWIIVHITMKTLRCKINRKEALKPEWIWFSLSYGEELIGIRTRIFHLEINVPESEPSLSYRISFCLCGPSPYTPLQPPRFKLSLFKIFPVCWFGEWFTWRFFYSPFCLKFRRKYESICCSFPFVLSLWSVQCL